MLSETKNRTLKCLNVTSRVVTSHLVWSMKNVAVLTVDGAFVLFLRPHPGGFDTQESPPPGIWHSRQKKC